MFPMMGPGLVWFSKLRIDIEITRLKRRLVVGLPMTLRNPPPVPATGAAAPATDVGLWSPPPARPRSFPNPIVLATRRFMLIWPGERRSCAAAAPRRVWDSDRASHTASG